MNPGALATTADRRMVSGVGIAALAAALVGLVVARQGALPALALVVAPAAALVALRSVWMMFAGTVAVATFLPFAVLPFDMGVRPSFLSIALVVTLATLLAVALIDRRERIRVGGPHALVLLIVGVTAFALLLGMGRGYSLQTVHDYAKFVLSILAFFVIAQLVRRWADARQVVWLLLAGTGGAAFLALTLYAAGPAVAHRALARLVPFGYPSDRVVRYIEDNPALAMRATGTSVDPNALGGLVMIGFVLAAAQLVMRHRVVPVWIACAIASLTGITMLLTYSRGAWVGAFAGLALVVLLRRPVLFFPAGAVGVVAISAGLGSSFIERLWLGFTLQDPATRLRIAEYRNAWDIIQRHPWFGVGFGDAPTIDLQVGVSSVYLTIAERAGLVGLAAFLTAAGVVVWRGLRVSGFGAGSAVADLMLACVAACVAMLTVGLVDHYFFNPQFSHMAALFWIVASLIVALSRPEVTSGTDAMGVSSRHAGHARSRAARAANQRSFNTRRQTGAR